MKKFNLFLLTTTALTSVLIGYLIVGTGSFTDLKAQSGTLSDKFDEQKPLQTKAKEDIELPVLLTEHSVVSPTLTFDKKGLLYFERNTGKVFEYDFDEKKERTVSDIVLPDFVSAKWSPDKKLTLNSYSSEGATIFGTFNPLTGERLGLEKEVRSVTFSNDGGLLAYYYFYNDPNSAKDPSAVNSGQILLAELNNSYQKKIIDTRLTDLSIDWPLLDKITLKANSTDLFVLSREGKLKKLLNQKLNLTYKWSPSGDKILFSSFEPVGDKSVPMLWLKDISSGTEVPLNLSGEASKCTWSIDDTTVYCAVPRSPSADDIYTIDTIATTNKVIYSAEMTLEEIHLSGLEESLVLLSQKTPSST